MMKIIGILKDAGKSIVEFSGIMSNPTYAKVQEGAKLARDNQADLILAVGGGSVMDCCKAVALAARYEGDIWEDFWARPGVIDFEPLPLGVVGHRGRHRQRMQRRRGYHQRGEKGQDRAGLSRSSTLALR